MEEPVGDLITALKHRIGKYAKDQGDKVNEGEKKNPKYQIAAY